MIYKMSKSKDSDKKRRRRKKREEFRKINKEKEFPSLCPLIDTKKKIVWVKNTNIFEKAKIGYILLNLLPRFTYSPEPPLFQ